jgi:hypothetical protein
VNKNELVFHKSSYSNGEGNCVEVADVPTGGTAVRDSKDTRGPILRFTAGEWSAFIAGVDAGEFRS